jgi:hypothetical protein
MLSSIEGIIGLLEDNVYEGMWFQHRDASLHIYMKCIVEQPFSRNIDLL